MRNPERFERPINSLQKQVEKPAWFISFIVITAFLCIYISTDYSWTIVNAIAGDWSRLNRVWVMGIVRWGIPWIFLPMLVTALLFGKSSVFEKLGINRPILKGLGFAFAVTLPLPFVYVLTTPLQEADTMIPDLLQYAVFAGVGEEVLFRCFLFGLLFRYARWGFLPAAFLGGLIFGMGHLYQGSTLAELGGVFLITFIGGLWWAWIYVEWNYNAWVPIGFHVFMNGWFQIFVVSETALLPIAGEIARAFVVLLSIGLTLVMARRRGGRTIKRHLWWKA